MMWAALVGAFASLICALVSGSWAIDRAAEGKNPGDEFISKQLAAGAWFFATFFVVFVCVAIYIEIGMV